VRQTILLSLFLILGSIAPAQLQPVAGFSTTGEWHFSNLPGPVAQKSTLWSSDANATATWNPQIKSVGPVRISFYVVGYPGNVPTATIEIVHAGKKEEQVIHMAENGSHWITIGTYDFSGASPEYLRLLHGSGPGNLRVAALRMEILDSKNPNLVWQNLLLDDLLPVNPTTLHARAVQFGDMVGNPAAADAGYLAASGILPGASASQFAPGQNLIVDGLRKAVDSLAQQAHLTLTSTTLNQLQGQSSFTGNEFLTILVEAAKSSGKNLDWVHASGDDARSMALALGLLTSSSSLAFNADSPVNRAETATLLRRFQQVMVDAGPPATGRWRLAFDDEFDGNTVDWSVWSSAHGELRSLSTRWPENAVVSGGQLHLITRKEHRGDAQWTAASIWTKSFEQKYGYWEARYRYAKTPGLNNAFWMIHNTSGNDGFEIDVNEGHYPNEVNATLHQSGVADDSTRYLAPVDLSQDFHVYGCKWDAQQVIYYMDGKEIARKPNKKANLPVPAMLSTAVLPWAGAPSDTLNGKGMDVDWVRVYTSAP
jgi:hypothetical protein